MNNMVNQDYELNNFESIQIGLASPEKIREWSHGEVTKPETINYRTLKPERDGLFCEKIFGPTKDWECYCGKYKKVRYKGIVCDKCGVEITKSKVRRERMGHIELATPVSHIWYFKGVPSRMALCVDVTPKNLEMVLYFACYIVTRGCVEVDENGEVVFEADGKTPVYVSGLEPKALLTEDQYWDMKDKYGNRFEAGMGAEAIRKLLADIDLEEESKKLRAELQKLTLKDEQKDKKVQKTSGQKKQKVIRRLEVIEALRISGNRPEWMVMTVLPVIPPDLRPMVQLDGGRFATSDLNDLYRRVINRNNRLKSMLEKRAPEIIVRNEKRMLQEAVDSLIDNGRRGRAVAGPGGRALKSLSDMLKGKQGRFRQNLLGKRVDYSGRSVIVVGPELKFYQCGLPKKMALELFKPFIMQALVSQGLAHNIKDARHMVERSAPQVWDVIGDIIKEHPVMLNRAPTLHRLGIQAFEPVLVEGKAIKLHPLACTAFNADFDGDQMAVHVPLSVEAQAEARFLMLSINNILAPKDGSPITTPTQDMILGSYYLTYPGVKEKDGKRKLDDFNDEDGYIRVPEKGDGKVFSNLDEMLMAYQTGKIGIHARVKVRTYLNENDERGKLVESTVGRFIFNQGIPQDLGFIDRTADPYSLEVDFLCGKKELGKIIDKCFKKHHNTGTVLMLDYIKATGYKYSTKAAITISVSDMEIPKEKWDIVGKAEKEVNKYENAYRMGILSDGERHEKVVEIWNGATDEVANVLMKSLDPLNNLQIMAHSGARGSKNQIRQVGGMRGLMGNAKGETVEIPIKSNFREGLSILEYFISSNGARKGLTDTALRTADSGYLTRRLVDVSHNLIIREEDCGSDEYIVAEKFVDGKEVIEDLSERLAGRTAFEDVVDAEGNVLCEKNEIISDAKAMEIEKAGVEQVKIRSIMTCHSRTGVCVRCYGRNLATGETVNIGEAVGIIAAQSIGEPGTQLTMRTFHTGGVAGGDITQGLPRVEELFEARTPKGIAKIAIADGTVVSKEPSGNETIIKTLDSEGKETSYTIPSGARIMVNVDDTVEAGTGLTRGPLDPKEIFKYRGAEGVQDYLLKEVKRVYKQQGVDINDKHIEVIVSQMLAKYSVEDPGDTTLLPGVLYTRFEIEDANSEALAEGKNPATFERVLRGITKASLATSSFLSAASFQETTKVLTDAAIKGKNDKLVGLKENVILGKLIPAGTGMRTYRDIEVDYKEHTSEIEAWEAQQELLRLQKEAEKKSASEKVSRELKNDTDDIAEIAEPDEENIVELI
ncbi:MAG: DNA-directed RNA polymerase subunit beta' [Clostridia bacterium]|nr:DNA-directed RNA polymerase subunit beta' [Clostridia bacterium]